MFEEGHKIRIALAECGRTQVWLINKLRNCGIITDRTEMSSALNGARRGPKIDKMLKISIEILDKYKDEHREE